MEKINTLYIDNQQLADQNWLTSVRKIISTKGYVLMRRFPLLTKQHYLEFCAKLGTPIAHTGKEDFVWDIRFRETPVGHINTFSEHQAEATLHTDSQYRDEPEHFFGLYCVTAAACGGGKSLLLSLNSVYKQLRITRAGRQAIEILQKELVPFLVPSAFRNSADDAFVKGLVLTKQGIRFRSDTIEKGFELFKSGIDPLVLKSYQTLKETIEKSKAIMSIQLQERDLLLINNRNMLHGRTAFSDEARHLWRIRLNFKKTF